jgi:hypothetical protein
MGREYVFQLDEKGTLSRARRLTSDFRSIAVIDDSLLAVGNI